MYVLLAGVNYKTAPVEVREEFAFTANNLERAYNTLKNEEFIEGVVILDTCNRTEIYATSKDISKGMVILNTFLLSYSGLDKEEVINYIYQKNCYDAIEHIFKVAAGLDSMILGEDQILGQVKKAYQQAADLDATDVVLNTLFNRAIFVGKKVRTDTDINKHSLSTAYIAVELARQRLGELTDKTVLVIGAGEIGELTTRYLMLNGVSSVIVSNRTYEKAVNMADNFNGRAIRFDDLPEELLKADIVISCTAAKHYVIHKDNCKEILEARQGEKIVFVDIAVPRDVDPKLGSIDGVFLYDIDDLQRVVDQHYDERKRAALEAEKIIQEQLEEFNEWLATLYVVPVITSLKMHGETIKQHELKKAFNRLGKISDREQEIINSMANAIVNRLLHAPIVNLKTMAVSNQGHLYAEIVKNLFELKGDSEEQELYAGSENWNQR